MTSAKLGSRNSALKHLKESQVKNNIFICEWERCLKEFKENDQFYEHIKDHIQEIVTLERKYCCCWDLCAFETNCNEKITRHIHYHAYHTVLKTFGESIVEKLKIPCCSKDTTKRNSIPELKSDFICYWNDCIKSFKSINLYHKHVQNHCSFEFEMSREKGKHCMVRCGWENCDKIFQKTYRLNEHVRKHTSEKVVGCYHCGALFRSNTIFFDHCKRQLANNTQEFHCDQCFKYFASERLLRSHELVHVNFLKCSLCDMTCSSPYSLARHIRYRHLKEKPFECANCGQRFVCWNDLTKHSQKVHEKKVYSCGELECNYTCKSLSLMNKHHAEIHEGVGGAVYACHCCEKIYKNAKSLSKHLIKVHGFQLPSGHRRFAYRLDEFGYYRLQTMRVESLEVSTQILSPGNKTSSKQNSLMGASVSKKINYNSMLGENSKFIKSEFSSIDQLCLEESSNILIAINDVDKDGHVIDTKFINAREIQI